ncbi:hypothetical protein OESDEN_04305, partial [Oesophagostomum dentatum]
LKCHVDRCIYKGPQYDSIGFRCTLPSNFEAAFQWICICVADVSRQNNLIIKLVNSLKDEDDDTSEQLHAIIRKPIPPERLLAFPFRVCNRHFNSIPAASVPIAPNVYLPKRPMYSREELFIRLRRRYVFLSEIGFEDVDLDRLEPNGVAIAPSDSPVSCCIPGCTYKSTDISLFSRRYVKMYSIPSISVDYGKWRKNIQNGLGIPSTFDFNLPDGGHICEMHFAEGKRYTRGVMQDPSVFRRLCVEGISPSLARLGSLCFARCALKNCISRDQVTVCVPYPKPGDALHALWTSSLRKADEKFTYTDDMVVCLRHFSFSWQDGVVPVLFLSSESKSESTGNQMSSKRRKADSVDETVKRSRLDSEGGPEFAPSSDGAVPEQKENCCDETQRISETVEQIDMKTGILERVVTQLDITCKNYYDSNGEFSQHMKFQLYDILSELKAQKNIVHSLRTKLEDSVKDFEKKFRWSLDAFPIVSLLEQ